MERIIQDDLLDRCREFINPFQDGFLSSKSCTTNLINITDDIASNLHNDIGTDIIYFDFAKAFDSVNHDLLLNKLKNMYKIDGRLLKFLTNYLKNRRQRVALENEFSEYQDVLSGVPQGSILGPFLFILFINDIGNGISDGTSICLFADDTKIWRAMQSEVDCSVLQGDIDYLNSWCNMNKMKFHPEKCKVVAIVSNSNKLAYLKLLPMSQYNYQLGSCILNYEDSEKDLGVIMNNQFSWIEHQVLITNKASQMLGLTKRTCHFLLNSRRKRTLYLVLVRSQFEHCSVIWRPVSLVQIQKFEVIQKNAIKWILNEEFLSYSEDEVYFNKCKQVNILPISRIFDLNDLVLFHKVINGFIPTTLPTYISKYNGQSRLRDSRLDSECYVFNLNIDRNTHLSSRSPLYRNYFYRTIHLWNKLPYSTRVIPCVRLFKQQSINFLWNSILERILI